MPTLSERVENLPDLGTFGIRAMPTVPQAAAGKIFHICHAGGHGNPQIVIGGGFRGGKLGFANQNAVRRQRGTIEFLRQGEQRGVAVVAHVSEDVGDGFAQRVGGDGTAVHFLDRLRVVGVRVPDDFHADN